MVRRSYFMKSIVWCFILIATLGFSTGCSIKRVAVNMVGDALAGSGASFSSDNDPELIKAAVPFSLKLMESLLAESPKHIGLLTATASGFTQYAYAFVQIDANETSEFDLSRSRKMMHRAKNLYIRARDYGLRGIEVNHPGFGERLENDPVSAVTGMKKKDVPLLYWTAAAWVAAIAADKTDAYLISDLPKIDALITQALKLDGGFDRGAIHSMMITYEPIRQGVEGDPYVRSREQFAKAVEQSDGKLAGPYVSLAEAVCIPTEARAEYLQLLDQAMAIDPDAAIESRLVNIIMRERAAWLKAHVDDYFLPPLIEN
jgi:predicted anti-sigma-YlaC factor YlaD